jgi:hypothetical protein
MSKKWEIKNCENLFEKVSLEEFKQIIDEYAELVYGYLCQLSESSLDPEIRSPISAERTGTDG